MRKNLQNIAAQLSEDDIQELIRIKKTGGKQLVALRKKRDKLAAQLEALDAEIAMIAGDAPAAKPRRGRKPAVQGKKKRGARVNLSGAVRDVMAKSGDPMRARDIVDGLPDAGIKVRDVAAMRKRVSVVLASQTNHFEQVERGVYRLKD